MKKNRNISFWCTNIIVDKMKDLVDHGHFLSKSEIIRCALYFFLEHKQIINLDNSKVVIDKKGKMWKVKDFE